MPSPFLRSSGGPRWEFYCSLCKTPLKSKMPRLVPPLSEHEKAVGQAKTALLKEWDEHLADVHPQQWEREQRKRARRRAATERQVLVECSSLPPPLRNDLQAFLERQPEVRAVWRRLRVSDTLLNPDTVGIVAPRFDLVAYLAERRPMTAEPADDRAATILKKVSEWTDAHRTRG
jgi:hypothetical protein